MLEKEEISKLERQICHITNENIELERRVESGLEAERQLILNREELKNLMQDYFSNENERGNQY